MNKAWYPLHILPIQCCSRIIYFHAVLIFRLQRPQNAYLHCLYLLRKYLRHLSICNIVLAVLRLMSGWLELLVSSAAAFLWISSTLWRYVRQTCDSIVICSSNVCFGALSMNSACAILSSMYLLYAKKQMGTEIFQSHRIDVCMHVCMYEPLACPCKKSRRGLGRDQNVRRLPKAI